MIDLRENSLKSSILLNLSLLNRTLTVLLCIIVEQSCLKYCILPKLSQIVSLTFELEFANQKFTINHEFMKLKAFCVTKVEKFSLSNQVIIYFNYSIFITSRLRPVLHNLQFLKYFRQKKRGLICMSTISTPTV